MREARADAGREEEATGEVVRKEWSEGEEEYIGDGAAKALIPLSLNIWWPPVGKPIASAGPRCPECISRRAK
jgi:hypothetical protein